MGTVEISVFAFRLAALYLWLQTLLRISYIPMFTPAFDSDPGRAIFSAYGIVVCLHALLGTVLWFGSRPLARHLFGNTPAKEMTNAAAIAGLGFVLAGILVVELALQEAGNLVYWRWISSTIGDSSSLRANTVSLVALSILGGVLVVGGRRLAARLFPTNGAARSLALEIQPVAFSILGAVIAARTIPDVLAMAVSGEWFDGAAETVWWPELAPDLLRLAIGIALFFGGGALSRLWRWTQTAGLAAPRP